MTASTAVVTRAISMVAVALLLGLSPPQRVAAQDGPQIYTPIGTFTIFSATLADEFPIGCTPAPYAAGTCSQGRDGRRLLIIHFRHDGGHDGTDFTEPIKEDMDSVEIVGDDGEEWQLGMTQWSSLDGVRLVFTGRGSPESIVLTWPGNRPMTLNTVDSDDTELEPEAAPATAPEPEAEPAPIPQPEATTGEVKGRLVSKSTGQAVRVEINLLRDQVEGEDQEELRRMMDAMENGPATGEGGFHLLRVPPGFYHLFTLKHGLIGEGFRVEAGEVVDLGIVEVR